MNTYGEQLISQVILMKYYQLFNYYNTFHLRCLIPVYLLLFSKYQDKCRTNPCFFTHLSKYIYGYKYTWLHLVDLLLPIVTLTENCCYSVCKHDNFPYCKQIEAVSKVWFVFQTRMEMFNMSDFLSKFLISTHLTMYTKLKDQNKIGLVKLISEEEKKTGNVSIYTLRTIDSTRKHIQYQIIGIS